jgi:hypothetical protein
VRAPFATKAPSDLGDTDSRRGGAWWPGGGIPYVYTFFYFDGNTYTQFLCLEFLNSLVPFFFNFFVLHEQYMQRKKFGRHMLAVSAKQSTQFLHRLKKTRFLH